MHGRSGDMVDPRLDEAARTASSAVQQAADVLEEQLSAGIGEVRRMTSSLAGERRIDKAAFEDLVARFRSNAHDLIEVAGRRVEDLRGEEAQQLAQRFTKDAHEVFDTVVDLVMLTPSMLGGIPWRRGKQQPDEEGNVDPNAPDFQPRPRDDVATRGGA